MGGGRARPPKGTHFGRPCTAPKADSFLGGLFSGSLARPPTGTHSSCGPCTAPKGNFVWGGGRAGPPKGTHSGGPCMSPKADSYLGEGSLWGALHGTRIGLVIHILGLALLPQGTLFGGAVPGPQKGLSCECLARPPKRTHFGEGSFWGGLHGAQSDICFWALHGVQKGLCWGGLARPPEGLIFWSLARPPKRTHFWEGSLRGTLLGPEMGLIHFLGLARPPRGLCLGVPCTAPRRGLILEGLARPQKRHRWGGVILGRLARPPPRPSENPRPPTI